MVREDILGGLKNAIERGDSEEEAKQSFLNSNYPEDEINEAMNYLKSLKHEEIAPPEETKKKEKIKQYKEIKEVKDIQKLMSREISEIPRPSQENNSPYLKYFLIGGGAFLFIVILIVILLVTKVINL